MCVNEKSQIHALNRTARILPLRPGLPEKQTHDNRRNGTTSLFAALEVATGKVPDRCYDRHTETEFLDFLKLLARTYPRRQLHVVCDNYASHKHPKVQAWLARRPRVQLHFTATSGSWLNMVEIFFGITTKQAIRRGTFESVRDLKSAIRTYINGWNDGCHPFIWTKDANTLLTSTKSNHFVTGTLANFRAQGLDVDDRRMPEGEVVWWSSAPLAGAPRSSGRTIPTATRS